MNNMMELCIKNKYDTDKYYYHNQYAHCYVERFYESRFHSRKYSATNIFEVGIGCGGGSLLLWKDYFENAQVTGADIMYCDKVSTQERISQIITDAYDKKFVDTLKDGYYDVIIDDGPHTFDSMVLFLERYLPKLKPNGIAVIEDIQDIEWCKSLVQLLPYHYRPYTEVIDLRNVKNRYDDILLVIDLPN